jgi:formylglycine-generating enzyme required for sulfatase activity
MKQKIKVMAVIIMLLLSASFISALPVEMVRIPGGTFTIGSPANEPGRLADELQRQVTISAFYMGKFVITQDEYEAVMGVNPSRFRGENLPVENISWFDAIEFCNKLSEREGLTPVYEITGTGANQAVTWNRNANGFRLPTEAEWEFACRAGTTTQFSTGNNITTYQANYDGRSPYNNNARGEFRRRTSAVNAFPPNEWGLYGKHGNVWEWCWDFYGDYTDTPKIDPTGPLPDYWNTNTIRVLRGGCWSVTAICSAHRVGGMGQWPEANNPRFGFRLVRP